LKMTTNYDNADNKHKDNYNDNGNDDDGNDDDGNMTKMTTSMTNDYDN
jgi:hypothetical protein